LENEFKSWRSSNVQIDDILVVGLVFNQKLKRNWEISGSSNMLLATDFSYAVTNADYNVNLLFYLQKRIDNFILRCGM
jgi:hypothetical protein